MTDEKRALLGDHEAAKRLTEGGVLGPCPMGQGEARLNNWGLGVERRKPAVVEG